ncbi:hypothetical protein BpHYR1_043169 [Brachionus plicatilis]|uniref:Uncharacterized protein n=1 Tax=Brachionus plicatilis TaxID=10195 RepID=A0A3M7QIN6_BRAPC|nr:hypothetical protein BpHYR1_043169 [Brachionus plicatilis]
MKIENILLLDSVKILSHFNYLNKFFLTSIIRINENHFCSRKISETAALKQRFVFEYKIDTEKCKSKVQIRMRINNPKNVSEKKVQYRRELELEN